MLTPVYTVLVIEDDLPLKMLIAQHLASLNYNVLTARSWKDAQALLELNEPDLIILDIRLPDANGLDLIKGLAGGYAVIVLTAYGSITNAVRAIKEGAFEYLTKPITQEELELNVAAGHGEPGTEAQLRLRPRPAARGPARRRGWHERGHEHADGPRQRRGAVQRDGADPRRKRRRQGGHRPRDPRTLPARRAQLRGARLLHAAGQLVRERAVRPRARRVHRRATP